MIKTLNESSLKRLWQYNEEHDCAALSAFRKAHNCGEGPVNVINNKGVKSPKTTT